MISSIRFFNFQSLKNVELDLGRVTVIRGKSDVGKSAVVRGLNSLFNNTFKDDYAFRALPKQEPTYPSGVSITKDGIEIKGQRTAKSVEYFLGNTSFTKTNKKVPEEIYNFSGIKPYAIDTDLNVLFQIQSQFDSPFLLKEPATTIAKIIGKISNLNIVMAAMRKMFADKSAETQNNNILIYSVDASKKKIEALSYVKKAKLLFSELELKYNAISEISDKVDSVTKLMSDIEEFSSKKTFLESRKHFLNALSLEMGNLEGDLTKFSNVMIAVSKVEEFSNKKAFFVSKQEKLSQSPIISEEETLSFSKAHDVINRIISFNEKSASLKLKKESLLVEEENFKVLFDNTTKDINICPLSGGQFFQSCKDLIKNG